MALRTMFPSGIDLRTEACGKRRPDAWIRERSQSSTQRLSLVVKTAVSELMMLGVDVDGHRTTNTDFGIVDRGKTNSC